MLRIREDLKSSCSFPRADVGIGPYSKENADFSALWGKPRPTAISLGDSVFGDQGIDSAVSQPLGDQLLAQLAHAGTLGGGDTVLLSSM